MSCFDGGVELVWAIDPVSSYTGDAKDIESVTADYEI
jgi:hypothetical protein